MTENQKNQKIQELVSLFDKIKDKNERKEIQAEIDYLNEVRTIPSRYYRH